MIRATGIGVAEAAKGSSETLKALDQTIERAYSIDGAEAIILGSGGLTGMANTLSARYKMPVIDCIEAAVMIAVTMKGCLHNFNQSDLVT